MDLTVAVIKKGNQKGFIDEILNTLSSHQDIEIIYTGSPEDLTSSASNNVKTLNLFSENKAYLKNQVINQSTKNNILWLSTENTIDEDFMEEVFEVIEENNDKNTIFYPNETVIDIFKNETVKNYRDLNGIEIEILQQLNIENLLPEYGVITPKNIFETYGYFDEDFEDYEFYRFISLNIKNLSLKLMEFSFITKHILDTFIDTSYHSKNLRDLLNIYDWKTEIFPNLNWKNEKVALATAYTIIAEKLSSYIDYYNASEFYKKSLLTFHNQYSLEGLINSYIKMGEFEKARYMLEKQGMEKEKQQEFLSNINSLEELIEKLEESINQGHLEDVMNALPDVISVYDGAPVYNILGAIQFITKDYENSFKSFYKAVTINPLKQEYKENLIDVSQIVGKVEKSKKLLKRLLS